MSWFSQTNSEWNFKFWMTVKAEKEKAEKIESENTDLLLKLMQQVHKPALNPGQNSSKTCPGPGPIKVQ